MAASSDYSDQDTKEWVTQGCQNAGIGCLECKKPVIDAITAELNRFRKKQSNSKMTDLVRSILLEGGEKARESARERLQKFAQQWVSVPGSKLMV